MTVGDLAWSAVAIGIAIGAGTVLTLVGLGVALLNRRLREARGEQPEP